jgi:hypothetical protein
MKRCLLLASACAGMWAQDRVIIVAPGSLPNPDQLKSIEDAFRRQKAIVVIKPDLPETAFLASTCAVPLLAAPINPNVDPAMPVLRPRKTEPESGGIIKPMSACSSRSSK